MMLKTVLQVLATSSMICVFSARTALTASENDYPFVVVLHLTFQPQYRICSGSLIGENWVITAGHCVKYLVDKPMLVRYGDFTKPPEQTKLFSNVTRKFIHPNLVYYSNKMMSANDIALLLVDTIKNVKLGRLLGAHYRTMVGLPVQYAGFEENLGGIHPTQDLDDGPIRVGEGVIVPCQKTTYHYGPALCMALKCSYRKKDHYEHSGAPLLFQGRIIGVGMLSGDIFPPVFVYAAVSSGMQWIVKVIQSNMRDLTAKRLVKNRQSQNAGLQRNYKHV